MLQDVVRKLNFPHTNWTWKQANIFVPDVYILQPFIYFGDSVTAVTRLLFLSLSYTWFSSCKFDFSDFLKNEAVGKYFGKWKYIPALICIDFKSATLAQTIIDREVGSWLTSGRKQTLDSLKV